MNDDAALGRKGERAAARYLKRKGHRVLGRNVRLAQGEVDLVTRDGETIVVVEVKTRRDGSSIPPEASVTSAKQRKLLTLTQELAAKNDWSGRAIRIDVVAVTWSEGVRRPSIRHYEHAVASAVIIPSSGGRRASRGRRTRA